MDDCSVDRFSPHVIASKPYTSRHSVGSSDLPLVVIDIFFGQ